MYSLMRQKRNTTLRKIFMQWQQPQGQQGVAVVAAAAVVGHGVDEERRHAAEKHGNATRERETIMSTSIGISHSFH